MKPSKSVLAKLIVGIAGALAVAAFAHAGVGDWLVARGQDIGVIDPGPTVSWSDIVKSGGIRIGQPEDRNGTMVLRVEYIDPKLSSMFAAGKAEIRKVGNQLVLVIAYRPGPQIKPEDRGPVRYAKLPALPRGTYDIFYESAGVAAMKLGKVETK